MATAPPGDSGDLLPYLDPAQPDLTACGADNLEDFATVLRTICSGAIDANGTLHYVVHARVSPLPLLIGQGDVTLTLVVDRNGRVLEQP